jgi:hypothetical protein
MLVDVFIALVLAAGILFLLSLAGCLIEWLGKRKT